MGLSKKRNKATSDFAHSPDGKNVQKIILQSWQTKEQNDGNKQVRLKLKIKSNQSNLWKDFSNSYQKNTGFETASK